MSSAPLPASLTSSWCIHQRLSSSKAGQGNSAEVRLNTAQSYSFSGAAKNVPGILIDAATICLPDEGCGPGHQLLTSQEVQTLWCHPEQRSRLQVWTWKLRNRQEEGLRRVTAHSSANYPPPCGSSSLATPAGTIKRVVSFQALSLHSAPAWEASSGRTIL